MSDESRGPANTRELLVFTLGNARFGVWIDEALEVADTPPISRLPLGHPEVPGVTSVRGDVLPVLDLGVRLMGSPAARPGRLLIVRHTETDTVVGLLVDAARSVVDVAPDQLRPPPAESGLPPELATAVYVGDDGVVTVLHLGHAAAPPRQPAAGR
jgi:purine-binding chemotaxis protein CheW